MLLLFASMVSVTISMESHSALRAAWLCGRAWFLETRLLHTVQVPDDFRSSFEKDVMRPKLSNITCGLLSVTPPGGGGTLRKLGQGCSVEDIFSLPPKITGFKFQPPKNNSIFGSKI